MLFILKLHWKSVWRKRIHIKLRKEKLRHHINHIRKFITLICSQSFTSLYSISFILFFAFHPIDKLLLPCLAVITLGYIGFFTIETTPPLVIRLLLPSIGSVSTSMVDTFSTSVVKTSSVSFSYTSFVSFLLIKVSLLHDLSFNRKYCKPSLDKNFIISPQRSYRIGRVPHFYFACTCFANISTVWQVSCGVYCSILIIIKST